ncbi:hypothetical protein ACP4OV_028794 [Aristida adscensionis]
MEHQKPKRPIVKVEESKWTGYFIEPRALPCSHHPETMIKYRREELVQNVRHMIQEYIRNNEDLLQGMKTVDTLERLGIGYHFEKEIATFMEVLQSKPAGDDLCSVALRFRLLRQHHYNLSSEIFKNFLDENGDFKDTLLRSNVDALLSLYEAAHLAQCGEEFLSGAIVFTKDCLSSLAKGSQLQEPVLEKVQHALASPTHRRIKRLEARLYISIYEADEARNEDILELAKLDFHIMQQMHRAEVKEISLWYKNLNPGSVLGRHIRERPVECYFWALNVFYEPQYAKARMMFAKIIKLMSLFDDTYDSYGTTEELHQFNQVFQRWDQEGAQQIGNYYAYLMSYICKTLEDFVTDAGASPMGIDCIIETFKEVSKGMLQEVVWRQEGHVPPVHEYLKVSAVTTCYCVLSVMSFVAMGANNDTLIWACSFPKFIESTATMCRLMDDIFGHEDEKERTMCVTAVDCYVQEHSVTVQQAKQALSCLVDEHWRIINQEFLSNNMVPVTLLVRVVNLARFMESMYRNVDRYTYSSEMAVPIHKLLNECVDH